MFKDRTKVCTTCIGEQWSNLYHFTCSGDQPLNCACHFHMMHNVECSGPDFGDNGGFTYYLIEPIILVPNSNVRNSHYLRWPRHGLNEMTYQTIKSWNCSLMLLTENDQCHAFFFKLKQWERVSHCNFYLYNKYTASYLHELKAVKKIKCSGLTLSFACVIAIFVFQWQSCHVVCCPKEGNNIRTDHHGGKGLDIACRCSCIWKSISFTTIIGSLE